MTKVERFNTIRRCDCIEGMNALPADSVNLAFADPPFNIGYEYDVYNDKQTRDAYLDWSSRWIAAVHRVLAADGSFWLAIGDEYAAELKLASQQVGFHPRSWVIWYYTFGVNCKQKFSRSHAHLFYFVKDPKRFTFRGDELENRIPSARQLVYADLRANPNGRLPDDTWVLRPQDLADCFTPDEDTWYFPRVAGTFKERAGFHGCQMPEQLLGRIIRLCSAPDDVVFDPFSGSATTVAVAKKLGRRYLAFDLSEDYVERGMARLNRVCVGDPLEGAAEPTLSAPPTVGPGVKGRRLQTTKRPQMKERPQATDRPRSTDHIAAPSAKPAPPASAQPGQLKALRDGLLAAFEATHDGYSLDRVIIDPELNGQLADRCRQQGLPGEPRSWNWTLFGMRKAGLLVEFAAHRRTEISWEDCENYSFASEIAWHEMVKGGAESLDAIFCDPFLAEEFDKIARRWAPGYTSLDYRWAAMKLRKSAKLVRSRAALLPDVACGKAISLASGSAKKLPEQSGIYVVSDSLGRQLYAGEAGNLRRRLERQFGAKTRPLWWGRDALSACYFPTTCAPTDRLAYRYRIVVKHRPELNFADAHEHATRGERAAAR